MTVTFDNAVIFANIINMALAEEDKVDVIEITKEWYMIVGNEVAKERYTALEKALEDEKNEHDLVGLENESPEC